MVPIVAAAPPALRRWLAFGSGVSITINGADLDVALVRTRPGGARWSAFHRIESFTTRPAAEWGREFAALVKDAGLSHAAALVLMPRDEVILRVLTLPGVSEAEIPAAIGFQLDSLHPYPDDEIVSDWRRVPETSHYLIAIAERSRVTRYTELFTEAGIPLAGLSCSAAAVWAALRVYNQPPAGFIAQAPGELYGESPSRPLFSALTGTAGERLIPSAVAELRLAPETEPHALTALLPVPKTLPSEEFDWKANVVPYAGALASACPHLAAPLNLLPAELRAGASRARYIPTLALAVLLGLTGIVLVAQGPWQDRQYFNLVRQETAKYEINAQKVEALDRQIAEAAARVRQLDAYRQRSKSDLDVLLELTRLLNPPAWVTSLEINRSTVTLSGEIDQAEGLLKPFDASPLFEASEFTTPIARGTAAETFRIRVTREGRK
jgi:hypothetical protein